MKKPIKLVRYSTPVLLLLALMPAFPSLAQQAVSLSPTERSRLGILTRPVQAADNSEGVKVPGVVISSPMAATQLVALYGGVVQRWLAGSGDSVSEGEALAEIRSAELISLQREWMQASTDLDQARFDAERDNRLFDEGVIAERRLMDARRRLDNAEFALDSAAEALRHAGFTEQDLKDLSTSGTRQGVYVVRAPVAGMLSHRLVEAGETIGAGMEIGSLTGTGNLWVEVSVPAGFARRLESGQHLRLADSPDEIVIRLMDQAIDNRTQTFDIHGEFLDGSDRHLPGEIVSVVLAAAGEGVWVPASAVVHSGLATIVYVDTPGGIEARTLDLLPGGSGYVATRGLRAGDRVVVQGAAVLKGIELGLGGDE